MRRPSQPLFQKAGEQMNIFSKLFPVGSRSLLFGVHQFFWHPWTVYRAWRYLYGKPTWREIVCIIVHDLGYWNKSNMDGEEGARHPEVGARFASRILGEEYGKLVLYHSRHYANLQNELPSKLCWADKLSILFDPKWFYLLRARSTGEIREYRQNGSSFVAVNMSDSEWYDWITDHFVEAARSGTIDAKRA
jgi:hypothetical protein